MRWILGSIFLSLCLSSVAQRQIVLLKKGHVLHRFNPGDDIYIKVKNNPERIHSYVNNILEEAIVLHRDTIPFDNIERIYIEEGSLLNVFGSALVVAGAGYFLLDAANNHFTFDENVAVSSAACITVGLPLMLSKKKSQKLSSYKYRLLTVKAGDPLYR